MENERSQKNLIILGGASGIGQATAYAFAKAGYGLALGDINVEAFETMKEELASLTTQIWKSKVDAATPAEVETFVNSAFDALGHLDVSVYSAGLVGGSAIVDLAPDQWDREIAVNLSGAFYYAQSVAKHMIRQRSGGVMLFISSIGATFPANKVSAYCAAKAGLNMFVQCLASELGNYRIRANAVMPGLIETNMTQWQLSKERYRNMLKATVPAGRWAQSEEVAALLLFLASKEASFINGQSIAIDGGATTQFRFNWWPLDYTKNQEIDWYELFNHFPYKYEKKK